jgi:hypothetical protein
MFIFNPDIYLKPNYNLSPFGTSYINKNINIQISKVSNLYFDNYFGENKWEFTKNGREGIFLALKNYKINVNDIVSIITTSGNKYISSCVTDTIEKFCNWSRKIEKNTKLILINHEFGFPVDRINELLDYNIPIIEDCCTSFFSQNEKNNLGLIGDFSIYSFPKYFPIQIGGLLVSNKFKNSFTSQITNDEIDFTNKVISNELNNKDFILLKRNENYNYILKLFENNGFTQRFNIQKDIVPFALLLNNNNIIKNLDKFKIYLNNNGIQSSIFYGEDAFFIPCHQNLSKNDLDYFYECILHYILNFNFN